MRQLSGVDALHVLEETEQQHMHTIKIALVGAREDGPVPVAEIRTWARERLPLIPPLRWRVHKIPLGLGRPVFVDLGPIDVEPLIRVESVPAPGDEREFDELVSDIASIQLPRDRPLWELTIVTGRADGAQALVFKLHHSIMDGLASVRFFELAFDHEDAGDAPPRVHSSVPAHPEPAPSPLALVRTALGSQVTLYSQLPRVVRRTVASITDNRTRKRSGAPAVVNPLTGPTTRFNRWPLSERVYRDVTVPQADIKQLRVATGATINEIFVTLCGGALRRYFEDHGETPDGCLNCAQPVSLRKPEEMDDFGNRTSYWYVSLGTDIADPLERLAHVKASLDAAREWAKGDVELFSVWQDYYLLFGVVTLKLLTLMERVTKRPAFNAVVSNVKGPRPLTLAGAPVVAVRSMGPITRSLGINFTVWTYRDDFSIGIHSCRDFLPDPDVFAGYFAAELAGLRAALGLAEPTAVSAAPRS
jgi:WS/DGAT/MGAT family acyltransferase